MAAKTASAAEHPLDSEDAWVRWLLRIDARNAILRARLPFAEEDRLLAELAARPAGPAVAEYVDVPTFVRIPGGVAAITA